MLCTTTWALKSLAQLALLPVCATSSLLGALQSFLHRMRTTNCCASCQLKPTRRTLPGENCCNLGTEPSCWCNKRRNYSVLFNMILCTMLNLPASSSATFKCLTCSFQSPFRGLRFDLEDAFMFFPLSIFQQKSTVSSSWECNQRLCLFKGILLPEVHVAIGLVSLPAVLSRPPSQTSSLSVFEKKSTPTSLYVLLFPKHSPQPATVRLHLHCCTPLPLRQGCLSFLPSDFRRDTADTTWPCGTPSSTTTKANCQYLRAFFLTATIVTPKHVFCGMLIALDTKLMSSASSGLKFNDSLT